MKKIKKMVFWLVLLNIVCLPILAVSAGAFPYTLTNDDLPGFVLIETLVDTESEIVQTWGTYLGYTANLRVQDYHSFSNASDFMDGRSDLGMISVNVSGADYALKIANNPPIIGVR